jgi:hypothetical protein
MPAPDGYRVYMYVDPRMKHNTRSRVAINMTTLVGIHRLVHCVEGSHPRLASSNSHSRD